MDFNVDGSENISLSKTSVSQVNLIPNLTDSSYRCVLKNFEQLSKSRNFLCLPYLWIKAITSSSDLVVANEKTVFEAVMAWIKFLPSSRLDKLSDLLSEVRMVYLDAGYLTERVASEEIIENIESCKELVQKVRNYHSFPKISDVFTNLETTPRKFSTLKEGIYAIGGGSYESGTCVYYCDFVNKMWHKLKYRIPYCNVRCAIATGEKIFMFLKRKIKTLNVKTGKWEIAVQPIESFNYSSTAVLHGKIIHCLYDDGRIYCFDTDQYLWYYRGRITTSKWLSKAASMGDSIYITGGVTTTRSLDSVEKYNPLTDECTEIVPMLTPRFRHGCTSLNGKIYVAGGYTKISSTGILKTAEVYDNLTEQWSFLSSMTIPCRTNFSLLPCNDEIYATNNNDFNIYDLESGYWKLGFHLPEGIKLVVSVPTGFQLKKIK